MEFLRRLGDHLLVRPAPAAAAVLALTGTLAAYNVQPGLQFLWSRAAGLNGEKGAVESAEFSPDVRFIVSGAKFDNSVIMWRASDGAELWRAYAAAEVERVGWSPDGKVVAAVSEDLLVTVFDAKTGAVVKALPQRTGLDALAWSSDGRWLAIGEEHVKGADGRYSGRAILYRWPGAWWTARWITATRSISWSSPPTTSCSTSRATAVSCAPTTPRT